MRIDLILFFLGSMFIIMGYVNQISPTCNEGIDVKIVPRNVYDQILKDSTIL